MTDSATLEQFGLGRVGNPSSRGEHRYLFTIVLGSLDASHLRRTLGQAFDWKLSEGDLLDLEDPSEASRLAADRRIPLTFFERSGYLFFHARAPKVGLSALIGLSYTRR